MKLNKKIHAFLELGSFLRDLSGYTSFDALNSLNGPKQDLLTLAHHIGQHNPWFTHEQVLNAFQAIGYQLQGKKMERWLARYPGIFDQRKPRRTMVIMAGNIPAVGFHDFLCVLISGHVFLGKPSRKEGDIMKHLALVLTDIEPDLSDQIFFTDQYSNEAEVCMATGSNNSARFFEYYFRSRPALIRKNRNGIAILTGQESNADLQLLATDIFSYYGLGCRNVSKIYLPHGYDPHHVATALEHMPWVTDHPHYMNNVKYQRAIMRIEDHPFIDAGSILLKEHRTIASPIGILHYEHYGSLDHLLKKLELETDQIQCIIGKSGESMIPFGKSQYPELWDYADHVDTIRFLTGGEG